MKVFILMQIEETVILEVLTVRLIRIIAVFVLSLNFTAPAVEQDTTDDLSEYFGFGEMEIIKLDWGISNLCICDLNGDGRNDIAIANNSKSRIELLIQKETISVDETYVTVEPEDEDVNAIFDSLPTRFKNESVSVSQRIYSLDCGDLNGDGMMDLAYYGDPKGLYVILQKKIEAADDQTKSLSWRTRKKIEINDAIMSTNALICADLNNDGRKDLVLAANDGVYFIEQTEDGSLAEEVKYPSTDRVIGIEVGDLNGDTINDLLLITDDSEKPLQVRFGSPSGQLGPLRLFFIEKPWVLRLHNIDGEIGDEILTIDAKSGRLVCYHFAAVNEQDDNWQLLFYPLQAGESDTKRDLVTADFDGDGLVDVVISDPGAAELIFYKQKKNYGLDEPVRFPAFSDITNLSAANINGDKKTELGVLSVKEKIVGIVNYEDNRLTFPKPLDLVGEPLAMELSDVDGDGAVDCLYISKSEENKRHLRVLYSAGKKESRKSTATETDMLEPALELKKLTANPDGVKVVDVDQDGLNDVLIFVKYQSPILVRQSQKREFEVIDSPRAQSSLIKEAALSSIAVSDIDGKKGQELLIAQSNFARSLIFADSEKWSVVDQYNAKSTENKISAVAAFDIDDKDSNPQPSIFLLDSQKGKLQMLSAGEDKTYRFEKEIDIGRWESADHLKILYAPLTEKKDKSIILFDSKKFALITPEKEAGRAERPEQIFSYETKIKDGIYGNFSAGDINSDDVADIIMVEYKNKHIEILTIDPEGKPAVGMRFKIFEEKDYREQATKTTVEPRWLKVADVTGDGKDDLVTIIHDRIIIYPQD